MTDALFFLSSSIDIDGALLWNKIPMDRATLQKNISREAVKRPQPEVNITVDKFSKYEIVAQTLADLQHRGLQKIGFVNSNLQQQGRERSRDSCNRQLFRQRRGHPVPCPLRVA